MYYKEFKFDDVLKQLGRGDCIAFMSDEKKYNRNSKVAMIGTNNDYTKVTGKVTELFPEKVYFTSNIMSDEYTFCGKLNLYEN